MLPVLILRNHKLSISTFATILIRALAEVKKMLLLIDLMKMGTVKC